MKQILFAAWVGVVCGSALSTRAETTPIPLAEHPRPDFQRADWLNLNGPWDFRFDAQNVGEGESWFQGKTAFPQKIIVPFPWGSELSQVKDEAPVGWYARTIRVPEAWRGKRIFLVVGASDWLTKGWLDGQSLGSFRGGYTPFEFELTPHLKFNEDQKLVLRVDDTPHPFKLEGKQGYGNARGIWQTAYLEARGQVYAKTVHFSPDIDQQKVGVRVRLSEPAKEDTEFTLQFRNGDRAESKVSRSIAARSQELKFSLPMPQARLWSLEDPFLYEVQAAVRTGQAPADTVATYFGMRKVWVTNLPGSPYPYIALNNRPVYLQITLDQSYHPEGFYTYPSDAFVRDEILRSLRIGLNAIRIHVKIDCPRKLYWADRLGLLVMADVPNSWGEPDAEARQETETALRGMLQRDFNHPAIFSWVIFNETWGLGTKDKGYTAETQDWVAAMYRLAKQLDPTRLVEDNSPCNNDHVVTDINSWHVYLPGYSWLDALDQVDRDTHPGSKWNFIGGRTQGSQPLLNSECGDVWGYEGSAGDVDWTWDYHIMMNEFRRHPKICGWLYTEHHDVINEWNGYYRFDRSEKYTGLSGIMPGMSLLDWHRPFYISTGSELCRDVKPGEKVQVPIWASFLTDQAPSPQLRLHTELFGWDDLGHRETYSRASYPIRFQPWLSKALTPLEVSMPNRSALAVLGLTLEDETGVVLHRNFTTFLVALGTSPGSEEVKIKNTKARVVRFSPAAFTDAKWSLKQWNVLDGAKVNGAGSGYFEYKVHWPENLVPEQIAGAVFKMEASAKQLFGKDRPGSSQPDGDFMRGKGTHDPSSNPNAYPMTDTVLFPSAVRVRVAAESLGNFQLPDDPADHQGILSWHAQKHDKKLREAGSYGYLIEATVPESALRGAAAAKEIVVRLEVDEGLPGGLAIYGERFGRYPIDPMFIFTLKEK